MLLRRLVAGLLVLGLLACLAGPAVVAQDKGKDKKEEKKEEKKEDKGSGGGDKVTLKWKFDKDKTFFQKMVTKTVQTMKVMNNDVNQTQNQTFYFSFKPTKVENDKVTIEQKIIGVAMDIEIGGSKINYDSTKDTTANNPLGDFFKALVDSTFTIELDTKDLKVTKVEGRDAFIQKLVAANPQMKPLLEVILSTDALKEMAEPTFAVVPNRDAAKGEKWKRTTKLDMGPIGKYENEYNYALEGSDKDAAKIKVDTVLNYKEPGEVAGQGGLPFKIKSAKLKSSNPVGEITFSPSKGRLEKSNTKLELKGELSIEIGGQATKVELSQTQESSIETSDQDPLPKKK
jgi:hypothetical protein